MKKLIGDILLGMAIGAAVFALFIVAILKWR